MTSDEFLRLLKSCSVTAVADVRSVPYSHYSPQFNQPNLQSSLRSAGIKLIPMGKWLGARSNNPACYINGKVSYHLLSSTPEYREGITRLLEEAETETLTVMCAEKDPVNCHRMILVSETLTNIYAQKMNHIHSNGDIETHQEALHRLTVLHKLDQPTLWDDSSRVQEALQLQEQRIAYTLPK